MGLISTQVIKKKSEKKNQNKHAVCYCAAGVIRLCDFHSVHCADFQTEVRRCNGFDSRLSCVVTCRRRDNVIDGVGAASWLRWDGRDFVVGGCSSHLFIR